jgi:Phosphotransferase enzyme family
MTDDVLAPIAAHLAEWATAHVELTIYGTADVRSVAAALEAHCQRELGSVPAKTLFYQSSIGAVAGLRLRDGRQVVVKAHQPDWTRERLAEIARLQSIVATDLGLAPQVLAGPTPLGSGFATVEEYIARGTTRDGHDPAIRRALAQSLYSVIERLSASATDSTLPPSLLASAPTAALWPRPHSRLFDFNATRDGAQYIDEIAAAARERLLPIGRRIIGHSDWRAEHVRFEGNRPVVAFDWDSLAAGPEPALVGTTAHMFCADWSRDDIAQAPTLEEARSFVADYQVAAGRCFTADERVLCGAAFAYSVAYTSRCAHAAGVDTRDQPGTFHYLISSAGTGLFDVCDQGMSASA